MLVANKPVKGLFGTRIYLAERERKLRAEVYTVNLLKTTYGQFEILHLKFLDKKIFIPFKQTGSDKYLTEQ